MPARSRSAPVLLSLAAAAALAGGWSLAGSAPRPRPPLVVDTHIDVPYRLREQGATPDDVATATLHGDFDAPRARRGGLDVAFLSIYVPAELQQQGGARAYADALIDLVEGIARAHPETFRIVTSPDEAEAAKRDGRIGLALGIENAAAFEDDLANIEHFYARGVRYATLTHAEDNLIGDSSYSDADRRTWHGLSPFGARVVAEMNRLGMMVDVSHVSDETFDAVLAVAQAPPIASHSSCRHFTPGFERNLDDGRIRALAAKGGVIQINFGSGFLTAAANAWSEEEWGAEEEFKRVTGAREGSPELEAWRAQYQTTKPFPRATIDDVVAHVEHVATLAGADHVGFGSDFDGVGPTTPSGLEDASKYGALLARLRARGHSEADVAAIAGGNLLRVWRACERVARASRRTSPASIVRELALRQAPAAPAD
jgi:membrane dipeptidase